MRRKMPVSAAVVLVAGLAACTGKDRYNPGSPLGTFRVSAATTGNTCGDDNAPPSPWLFDVRLSRERSTLYWIQGGAPVSGPIDDNGHARLTDFDQKTLHEADARRGVGFCAVSRVDTFDATLENGADAGVDAFTGTLVYRFAATEGSDCADVVEAGTFGALPCEIHFDLTGKRAPR